MSSCKAKKIAFSYFHSHFFFLFELVHVDIWGPYSTPSLNGSKYFLTIVDDYSRCTWVFCYHRNLMHHLDFHLSTTLCLLSFILKLKQSGLIMVLSLLYNLFIVPKESYINCLVSKHLNKILLSKENINTFLM